MKKLQNIKKNLNIKSIPKTTSKSLKGGMDRTTNTGGGCPPPEDD